MINTLINVLGKPEITVSQNEVVEGNLKETESVAENDRIKEIIEDNDFYTILNQDQVPYTMVIGDGAYFVNIDPNLTDKPIIEFIDGRNVEFERKANRITAITARKYYLHENKAYMLTDRRSTSLVKDKDGKNKRIATVEYNLYELKDLTSKEVLKPVEFKTIPELKDLENLEFIYIDTILAVPCVYRYDKEVERGESFFRGKLDLFDDLDQSKSQKSNITRKSTPIDYVPEELMDFDKDGKPKKLNRYDRSYIVLPASKNAVGQNMDKIETTQPTLNFGEYSNQELEIVGDILSGLMSPATLGIDLARKDNATAQREKEKVTLVTRDYLVDIQGQILKKLFNIVLKLQDYITNPNEKPGDYEVTVNYPDYANPSFENKLAYLVPAFSSGAMSAENFVNELWGDALSKDDKEKEVAIIEKYKNAYQQIGGDNPFENILVG